jgi:ABC-type sugar transport system ATPase subunit
MPEVQFKNVQKSFGSSAVVRDLTLTVRDGEFFTFVGPSGCGKSTILNMIAGLEPVSAGEILFDGKVINGLSPKERDVAMVFQSYALYPHMTVRGNIAFPLVMQRRRKDAIEAEVRRVAELLGIGDLLDKKPGELSGGQRQRVALGRAIIRKPRLFLMDEPLSNLDARLRFEMRTELKRLHGTLGITTIYVTHDQAEAMSLSDRVAVLQGGMIQQCDAPQDVYRYPANIFVAGFIGSPAMNILPCIVQQAKPLIVDCQGFTLPVPTAVPPGTSEVLIGFRPEDSLVESIRRENSIAVTVSVIESAGRHNWVEVAWNSGKVTGMSLPEDDVLPGREAFLTVSSERLSVFDRSSGKRL